MNLFEYVRSNPQFSRDPFGLAEEAMTSRESRRDAERNRPVFIAGYVHSPTGPYHAPPGVKLSCTHADTCPQLIVKSTELAQMIASHIEWDMSHPDRGFPKGRHCQETADLQRAFNKCATIILVKCPPPCPPPRTAPDPVPTNPPIRVPIPESRVEAPDVAKAVVVVGGAAAVGYGIYRFVRFLPSLVPPLWWTIPTNLAVP
jgi:hypothetical protein